MSMLPFRRRMLSAAALSAAACVARLSWAQGAPYPSRPVKVIVPFGAGGTADLVARIVCEQLTGRLDAPFVVENRPGAGGTIGSDLLAKSPADGYTLGWGSVSTHATSVSLYPKLPYDPQKDFTPIARVAAIPNVMVVSGQLPVQNLQEFIELARKSPSKLNFGSIGNATSQHLGGELFKMRTGVDMVHVPYRNNGALTGDLINGTLHVVFDNLPNVLGQVQAGKLRALGITTEQRWPLLPDVPTLSELGVKDFDISSWLGMFGPAGLQADAVARLNASINQIVESPEVREKLIKAGAQPQSGPPQALSDHVKAEIDRWSKVVKTSNAKID
jgi:tripartite-type tricarboxylate transporter receptor subunit TctC